MYAGVPIIGIAGGVGSGKSHVARLFGQLGCVVIDSDAQVTEAYALPEVREAIRQWWGDAVLLPDGRVDRRAIAARVFASREERARLEALIHPVVARLRDEKMHAAVTPVTPVAFVWDTPLLFETGLAAACDAVVFVDTPRAARVARVRATREWDEAELDRRENSQWPLDKKRALSHHVLTNAAADDVTAAVPHPVNPGVPDGPAGGDPAPLRDQVRRVLSRILTENRGTVAGRGVDFGRKPGPAQSNERRVGD
ncbi:MAG TPA: dephospho-CoA kinase [Humisphaera sp.]